LLHELIFLAACSALTIMAREVSCAVRSLIDIATGVPNPAAFQRKGHDTHIVWFTEFAPDERKRQGALAQA
jgi:hypothetical protein